MMCENSDFQLEGAAGGPKTTAYVTGRQKTFATVDDIGAACGSDYTKTIAVANGAPCAHASPGRTPSPLASRSGLTGVATVVVPGHHPGVKTTQGEAARPRGTLTAVHLPPQAAQAPSRFATRRAPSPCRISSNSTPTARRRHPSPSKRSSTTTTPPPCPRSARQAPPRGARCRCKPPRAEVQGRRASLAKS